MTFATIIMFVINYPKGGVNANDRGKEKRNQRENDHGDCPSQKGAWPQRHRTGSTAQSSPLSRLKWFPVA